MIVGYARTSTIEQIAGFESQLLALKKAGCEKIYQEQVSSVGNRVQLDAVMEFVREHDTLVVTKLDRLARSMKDLMDIIQELDRKKVGLRILDLGIDTQTPTGKLMLTILGGIAQFEREVMLERQREGVNKAKSEGKYTGRKPIDDKRKALILELDKQGLTRAKIAKSVGVGQATVYRVLASNKKY
ncbi:MAG TPA: recombinase family protein [Agitococcus sp.]|jgi:DNA invertase Pin-like site-specific DNA recombinase|nr:recombinase family protein [Agitococcus sp.]